MGDALKAEDRSHCLAPGLSAALSILKPWSSSSRPTEVQSVAERFNAAPFDIEGVFWSHRGEGCTFDTMLERTGASNRAAREALNGRWSPQTRRALTLRRKRRRPVRRLAPGLSRMYSDDLEQLAAGMTLYDAFYRWARDASDETHDWPTNKPRKCA